MYLILCQERLQFGESFADRREEFDSIPTRETCALCAPRYAQWRSARDKSSSARSQRRRVRVLSSCRLATRMHFGKNFKRPRIACSRRWIKSGAVHRYYACSTQKRQGPTGCKGRSIRVDRRDEAVTRHVIQRILESERLAGLLDTLALRRKEQEQAADRRITEIEGKLREAEQLLQRLYSMIEKGQTTR